MKFKYKVNDIPKVSEILLDGITWAIVASTFVIIIGSVIASIQTTNIDDKIWYIQKLMLITGFGIVIHILYGHKLSAIYGPAGIFLVAAVASVCSTPAAFSTALIIGGVMYVLIAQTNVLVHISKLFTTRVVPSHPL